MQCPMLPLENVTTVILEGNFVELLQQALKHRGFYHGPIDKRYGPETAAALRAFQDSRPVSTFEDQVYRLVNVRLAGCATYRALGLPCDSVYPMLGVTGDDLTVAAIVAAITSGQLRPECGIRLPSLPPIPVLPGTLAGFIVGAFPYILAGGVGLLAGILLVRWAGRREG